MDGVQGSCNFIKTAQIAVIPGHNCGMQYDQLLLDFRVPEIAASEVLKRYTFRGGSIFQSPQETHHIYQPSCQERHCLREPEKKSLDFYYEHFLRIWPGIRVCSDSMKSETCAMCWAKWQEPGSKPAHLWKLGFQDDIYRSTPGVDKWRMKNSDFVRRI